MKNKNGLEKKLKEITLLITVLLAMMTTKGFCSMHNSRIETSHGLSETSEKKKASDANDVDLGLGDDNQIKVYESLVVEINDLKEALERTKKEVEQKVAYQMQCNESAINSVNTSISGASYAIVIFTVLVGVGGILLGVYITLVERKVRNLTNENKSILETHLKIKDDVEKLNNNINKNMTELYNKLKREETKSLVERLIKVPEDIQNLFYNLASREVPSELYPNFKEAYQKLKAESTTTKTLQLQGGYLTLFFQHFPALALFDKDLENEIETWYHGSMASSFKNDIIKTSCEFLSVCQDTGILDYRDKIKKYFIALSKSKHKDLAELHREIYKTLSTKENRFNFYSILQSEGELKQISKVYGQHILTDYKDASGNTDSEKLVLKEITQEAEDKKTL